MIRLAALALILFVACAKTPGDPTSKTHASPLGYRATLPADWIVVDKAGIASLDGALRSELEGRVDPSAVETVRASIATGNMEVIFLPTGSDAYRDNLNILRVPGSLPATAAAVPMTCKLSQRQLSETLRIPIEFAHCDFVRLGGARAFHLEWGNPNQGSRMLQYHLELTPSTILVVTGGFTAATAATSDERLRKFIASMKLGERP